MRNQAVRRPAFLGIRAEIKMKVTSKTTDRQFCSQICNITISFALNVYTAPVYTAAVYTVSVYIVPVYTVPVP